MSQRVSQLLYGCNFVGVVYGAFTHTSDTNEERKQLFIRTAFKHFFFILNYHWLVFLKLDIKIFRKLNLLNDLSAFMCCFPQYAIIMYPAFGQYLTKKEIQTPKSIESDKPLEEFLKEESIESILEKLNEVEK